jgi:hypothetical protein
MTKPASHAEAALYELCVNYGYCLPSYEMQPLLTHPPDDPDAFVDAVLAAEV